MGSKRAVFLDRDGVINASIIRDGKPHPPSDIREVTITPDAEASLVRLKQNGFLLLVVTNQPDVRRGSTTKEKVEEINRFLAANLSLDGFFVCYHDDHDRCGCRKPLPGLLFEAADEYNVDTAKSYLIGDRWKDIEAGAAAGCRTILIDYGYNEPKARSSPNKTALSLSEAVDWILREETTEN